MDSLLQRKVNSPGARETINNGVFSLHFGHRDYETIGIYPSVLVAPQEAQDLNYIRRTPNYCEFYISFSSNDDDSL